MHKLLVLILLGCFGFTMLMPSSASAHVKKHHHHHHHHHKA